MRYQAVLAAAALLAGCSASPATFAPATPTPTGEEAALPTPAPVEMALPTPALTPTLVLPDSLTAAELHQRLDPLAGVGTACTLPCYNGLTAGQAGLAEVLDFYARLGLGPEDLIPGDYEAAQDGTGRLGAWLNKASDEVQAEQSGLIPPLVDIYIEDNILQYVYVGWSYSPPYVTLARVLGTLGQPGQVGIGLALDAEPPTYIVRLVYPAQRAGFAFYGAIRSEVGQQQVCFSEADIQRVFFGVFAPEVPMMEGLAYSESLVALAGLGVPYEDFAAQADAGGCLPLPGP